MTERRTNVATFRVTAIMSNTATLHGKHSGYRYTHECRCNTEIYKIVQYQTRCGYV